MIKRVLFKSCFQSFFPQVQCLVVIKRSLVWFQVPPLHFFERYLSDFVSLVVNLKFSELVGELVLDLDVQNHFSDFLGGDLENEIPAMLVSSVSAHSASAD